MRHLIRLSALALIVILASACGLLPGNLPFLGSTAPTPAPTLVPTLLIPTVPLSLPTFAPGTASTAIPTIAPITIPAIASTVAPTATATLLPNTLPTLALGTVVAPPPTLTSGTPSPKRINFPAGGTTAFVQGSIASKGIDRYVLRALAGQAMSLGLVTAQGPAILVAFGTDGTVLVPASANATTWSGKLPSTQDYTVEIRSTGATAVNYALQVTIPPLATTGPQSTPRRITFQPGATTATMQGSTATSGMDRFVLRVLSGQTMTVNITSAQNNVILIIYGADGNVLISDHAGATTWTGVIPTTQDYFIDTRSVGSNVVPFTLKVTIPPLTSVPATAVPKRITFPTGGTSATLQGTLAVNGIDRYVIRANSGQRMTVTVTPVQGTVIFSVSGADGSVLKSSGVAGATWTGQLPLTQDYYIGINSPTSAAAVYSLMVSIPPGP